MEYTANVKSFGLEQFEEESDGGKQVVQVCICVCVSFKLTHHNVLLLMYAELFNSCR